MEARMMTEEEESLLQKVNLLNKTTWPSPLPQMYWGTWTEGAL